MSHTSCARLLQMHIEINAIIQLLANVQKFASVMQQQHALHYDELICGIDLKTIGEGK